MKLKTTTITQKVIIPASPDEVYDAFINPKKHSAFTGAKATGEPIVGAEITAWDGYITGKNLELEKGKRIVQEWSTNEWPEGYPPSKLTLIFSKVEGGTELTMIHSEVPAEQAEDYRQGWIDSYWDLMKKYFKNKKKTNPKK